MVLPNIHLFTSHSGVVWFLFLIPHASWAMALTVRATPALAQKTMPEGSFRPVFFWTVLYQVTRKETLLSSALMRKPFSRVVPEGAGSLLPMTSKPTSEGRKLLESL